MKQDGNTGTPCGHRSAGEYVMIDSDCPITRSVIQSFPFRAERESTQGNFTFTANNYWSATENNATNAWYVNFNNGNTNNNNKTNNNYVRCVR